MDLNELFVEFEETSNFYRTKEKDEDIARAKYAGSLEAIIMIIAMNFPETREKIKELIKRKE